MKTFFQKNLRKATSGTLVLALLFSVLSPWGNLAFAAATLNVDTSCIDTTPADGVCDDSVTFKTIQEAITASASGDTITIAAGTYVENVKITDKTNITLQGAGTGTVIEPIDSGTGSGIGFEVRTSNDITIKDLKIQTTGTGAHGILVDGKGTGGFGTPDGGVSNNLHIENTTIDAGGTGIWGDSSADGVHSDWLITGNTITGQEGGIGFQDVTNATVSYNTITNPAVGTNILLTSERYNLSNLVIDHNTVSGSAGSEVVVITDYNHTPNNVVTESGPVYTTISGVTFSNNTFSNWGSAGVGRAIRVGQGDANATPGTVVTGISITGNTFEMTIDTPEVIRGTDAPNATGSGNTFNVSGTAKIQKAIDDAFSGDTINVAAGTYTEQLIINKDLTLIGVGDTTIVQSPDTLTPTFNDFKGRSMEPIITVSGATANISYLKVDGAKKGESITNFVGIGLYNAGGTLDHVTVTGVRRTTDNANMQGDAIRAINDNGGDRTLNITNSIISDFQKFGLTLAGSGLTVAVSGNTVTGSGANDITAQNGIHIGVGATGSVTGNTVSNLMCDSATLCGNNWYSKSQAIAIDIAGAVGITVSGNTVSNSDIGIYSELNGDSDVATITNNILTNNRWFGMLFEKGVATVSSGSVTGGEIGIFNPSEHDTGTTTVHNVNISSNSTRDVQNDAASLVVDATNNWWGNIDPNFATTTSGSINHDPYYINVGMTQTNVQAAADLDTATGAAAALTSTGYVDFSAVTAALALSGTTNTLVLAKTVAINSAISALVSWQNLYTSIWTSLASSWIANNFTGVTNSNVNNYTWLYFEKTGFGKILFNSGMDLTSSWTIVFLQSLPSYLDMSDWHINFNAAGSVFQNNWAQLSMYFTGADVLSFSGNALDYVTARNSSNTIVTDALSWSLLTCAISPFDPYSICTFWSNHFTSFDFNPYLTSVHIVSNNASGSLSKAWNTISLSFTGSETLSWVTVTIAGQTASVVWGGDSRVATYTMTWGETQWAVAFTINYFDLNNNSWVQVTGTTDWSNVTFDTDAPVITMLGTSPVTIAQSSVYTDSGATALDNVDGDITALISTGGTFAGTSSTGSFTITYDVTDAAGNTGSTVTRTILIVDKTNLDTAKADAAALTQANYTASTWDTLTGALALSETTNTEVIDKTTAINDAIAGLILNTSGTDEITSTGSTTLTGSTVGTGETLEITSPLVINSDSMTGSLSLSGTDITVTGSTDWDGILLPPSITTGSGEASTSELVASLGSDLSGAIVVQTIQVGASGASLVAVGEAFHVSFFVSGYASGTLLDLYRSENGTTWVRNTPDGSCTLDAGSMCTFRTDHLSYFAPVVDYTPDAFNFTAQTGKELSTAYESNPITVAGINTGSTISITGGQYKIWAGSYTGAVGTVQSGSVITLKLTSSASYSTAVSTTLTIGGVSSSFSVTTKAAPSSGGGGGGGSVSKDVCPGGDYTASYYDGLCGTAASLSGAVIDIQKMNNEVTVTTTTASGITTTTIFHIPGLVLKSLSEIKFTDISSNWAKGYIEHLVARGVIDNTDKYNPDNNLTRAEFLKIAFNTAGWETSATGTTVFKDVAAGAWYTPYISLALSKGIVSDRFTNFRPNDTISRAEAAKIIVGIFGGNTTNRKITFEDVNISSDLTKYIETAKILGFFSGQVIDGKLKFRPNDSITRAEIAKVVVNAFGL